MPTARIELAAGTYDVIIDGTPSTVTVPTLTAGSIDNVSPTEGDTLTVTAGNETATATYQWQKDGVNITGATSASLDTTGEGAGDYRRGVSDGLQGPVYTAAVTVSAAATVPAQMSAPTLAVDSASQITATLAADPADNGSAITSYDLRYSTDEVAWTDAIGVTSPHAITGLSASTLYYVQTRAVNAVGAGAWSVSATATTSAASGITLVDSGFAEYSAVPDTSNQDLTITALASASEGDVVAVIFAGRNDSGTTPNQPVVTIGGVLATNRIYLESGGSTSRMGCGLYTCTVPSGGLTNIVNVDSTALGVFGFQIASAWVLSGATEVPNDTAQLAGVDPATTIDKPAGGYIVAGAISQGDAASLHTYIGATRSSRSQIGSSVIYSFASDATTAETGAAFDVDFEIPLLSNSAVAGTFSPA